ncbi:unnamed protein product [Mytilus edulis]|uniref:Endonuclease/exonuclease/phosphatase domain-containing protein n=1 Tax=Mytilus edulis TaxID=6550 RepID=A0A8S3U7G4_MYTED|nr:unnamed protein product [Mytilus edulis]
MAAATESSSSRVSKPPSKFSDCLMGVDFDKMFEDKPVNDPSKIEIAVEHPQLVIQGAKCTAFSDQYFTTLKSKIEADFDNEVFINNHDNTAVDVHDISDNDCSQTKLKQLDIETIDSNNNSTGIIELDTVEDNKTSTPSRKSKSSVNNLSTPKDRVLQHGKSIDSRFTEIHTILSTIDNSIKSFVNMLSDLKHSTDHVPNNMQSMITEIVSTNKKKIMENLVLIETKMKHSSQSLDSLHTKSNLIDSQLKKMDTAHNENKNLLSNLTSLVINLQDRVDQLENKLSEPLHEGKCNTQNDQQLQHPSLNNTTELETETPTKPQIGINFVTKDKDQHKIISDRQNAEEPNRDVPKINCDYLILSDSILRRIQPNRFTPKQKTVKRYIRGGANTCTSFIEKNGTTINAKNILIHIGTRDLQSEGVKEEEFGNLLEIASKTWNSSKIFILPIVKRKDIPNEDVNEANKILQSACNFFPHVCLIDPFEPSEDMFYDDVHLNNNRGLPNMVKHLKMAMNIYRPTENHGFRPTQRHTSSTSRHVNNRREVKDYHDYGRNINQQNSTASYVTNNWDIERPISNQTMEPHPITPPAYIQGSSHYQQPSSFPQQNFMPWLPPPNFQPPLMPWQNPWQWPPFGQDIYLAAVYVSPENSSCNVPDINSVYAHLLSDIEKYCKLGDIMVQGDFNAHTNTSPDYVLFDESKQPYVVDNYYVEDSIMPRNNLDPKRINNSGRCLLDLCKETSLTILNGRTIGFD